VNFNDCIKIFNKNMLDDNYFDSETTPATIVANGELVVAVYNEFGKPYILQLDKQAYGAKIGQKVIVRYELSHPEKAVINQAWGYWFIGKEMAWSFGIFVVLLGAAFATTNQPHPDALAEQLNYKQENKTKYQ
jgi:hypothetical protein